MSGSNAGLWEIGARGGEGARRAVIISWLRIIRKFIFFVVVGAYVVTYIRI